VHYGDLVFKECTNKSYVVVVVFV